jgi:hypothetical protein
MDLLHSPAPQPQEDTMTTKRIDEAQIVRCNRCGSISCAWVKSERTGRYYLAYANQGSYRSPGAVVHTHILHDCTNPATGGKATTTDSPAADIVDQYPADLMDAARAYTASSDAAFSEQADNAQTDTAEDVHNAVKATLMEYDPESRKGALSAARVETASRFEVGRNYFNAEGPAPETRNWFELSVAEQVAYCKAAAPKRTPTKDQERQLGWFGNSAGFEAMRKAAAGEQGTLF